MESSVFYTKYRDGSISFSVTLDPSVVKRMKESDAQLDEHEAELVALLDLIKDWYWIKHRVPSLDTYYELTGRNAGLREALSDICSSLGKYELLPAWDPRRDVADEIADKLSEFIDKGNGKLKVSSLYGKMGFA